MQFIKEFLFGVRRQPVDYISTKLNSSYPQNPPSFEEWCKEFRVGMLYDRKIIHL